MPQSIACPACRGDVVIPAAHAGRFPTSCPTCGATLDVVVPEPGAGTIAVEVADGSAAPGHLRATAIASGWLGRYRVVGADRGRAWGVGPTVLLGVVPPRWAADPRAVARWVLEAFAAGELRHPNLLRPIGIEAARGRIGGAGSLGRGRPLSDPAARGDLDRQGRVAAVLHAARGLRFAHEQGVAHRGLDLASIRTDVEGRVAIAGLGLATSTAAEGAGVDVRGDVAGLGWILQTLLAGSSGNRAVPPELAALARRLMGVDGADEAFRDLGAVVRVLEAELGVSGPLVPAEREAAEFEAAAAEYHAAPLLAIRRWVAPGAAAMLALVVLACLATGRIVGAVGWVGFGGAIAAALGGFRAWEARARLADRTAAALAAPGRRDLGTVAVVALLGVATLAATHFLMTALIAATLAIGLAAAYHFGLDQPLAASRAEALGRLRGLVRGWRRLGYDEGAIRRYVAAAGGKSWEELFAALFGLAALPPARLAWGADVAGGRRPRFAPVGGWLLAMGDGVLARRRDERARALLGPILERDLEARGVHVLTARRRSQRAAAAVVAVLGQFRRSAEGSVGLPLADALRRAVDRPEDFLASPEIADDAAPSAWRATLAAIYAAAFGSRVRFLLGVASLAAAFTWMEQNALVSYEEGKQAVLTATVEGDRAHALDQARRIGARFVAGVARVADAPARANEPIDLGPLPPSIAAHLNGFALAASGLILLASAGVAGPRIIPFALLGAAIPLAPRLVVPAARPLDPASLVAMAVGLAVFAVGVRRERRAGPVIED